MRAEAFFGGADLEVFVVDFDDLGGPNLRIKGLDPTVGAGLSTGSS
jgi:hypothetical protein